MTHSEDLSECVCSIKNNQPKIKMTYKKTYRNNDIEKLRNLMYLMGFQYHGIDGWHDPHGNATGIFYGKGEWFTIWEQKSK